MGMTLTKEFVNSCRKVGALRDFLCQAIDQVAEKDKKIAELKEQYKDMDVTHTVHIAKMNAKIEELEEDVDFCKKENRRLKRALWLARAERAKEMCQRLLIQGFDPKWQNVEHKCLKKAEEYK